MYLFITLAVTLISFYIIKILKKRKYIEKCLNKIPGPPPFLFLGNANDFFRGKDVLDVLVNYWKTYGSIVKIQFTPLRYGLVVTDYEFLKEFLLGNNNLTKSQIYKFTKVWLGEGVLTTPEEKWRNQRKICAPTFSNKVLVDFLSIFDDQSDILIDKIKQITPVNSFDIHNYLSLCSLDIVCETIMGVSIHAQTNEHSDFVKSVKEMCEIIIARSMKIWKHPNLLFMFSSEYRRQQKCLKIINSYTNQVITSRKEYRANNPSEKSKQKSTLLDTLLEYSETEEVLKEQQLLDEVHTFMFAGHDTTSSAMEFVIYSLSKYPDVQRRAYEEQISIFGDNLHKEVNIDDIQEMKYLEMVIKETIRLYTIVPVISRLITKEFKFKNYVIPEGVTLTILLHGLHRNPELFPDPDVFNPSRFENATAIQPFSLYPSALAQEIVLAKNMLFTK
ncbi:hypothetical protein WA026_009717 [Henosepilachna vigintioctopunctata]|uniref:Cytochrome P450 n=1 Tax=Henosepilachna vigintioctopunctata TaxID=420089 RepID=A0AAW1TRL4_9CUCU